MTAPAPRMKPPLLPSETFRRVQRIARFDGLSVLGVSGAFALISAASRDVPGALIGLLVAAAGAIELHGLTLLKVGRSRGMNWLITSQLYLMAILLGYSAVKLLRPDIEPLRTVVTTELTEQIRLAGMTVDQFLLTFLRLVYVGVAAATVLYQGGMTVYYVRRKSAVEAALLEEELE